jgi:hypothetical protein
MDIFFPDGPSFVTAFEPNEGAMEVAHHMRLFSCAPGNTFEILIIQPDNGSKIGRPSTQRHNFLA